MTFEDIDNLAKKKIPFLFISDFEAKNLKAIALNELHNFDIEFCINEESKPKKHNSFLQKQPVSFDIYKSKFDCITEEIKNGNTYLLNLTQPTKIKSSLNLKHIYNIANANYKLRYKDEFVCFSPEKFISIKDNKIHTYPMKGTIDASIPHAKDKILSNEKEMAEHVMVVDLLRNDLSMVAQNVRVEKFRYVTQIEAGDKKLLQVSSHISGDLERFWHVRLGSILKSLLPAGSISGAPKKSTMEIIKNTEGYERGFFSGVFGVFDGRSFESGVMIRFIEKTQGGYVYKSGGGITIQSDTKEEYDELLDKVYLP